VNRRLAPVWRVGLPFGWEGVPAVADDLSLVAFSRGDEVLLLDGDGGRVARVPLASSGMAVRGGDCVFARDGRHLWVSASLDARHELWLIDLVDLRVVDHRRLDTIAVGFFPFHHPDGQTIGLGLPEGPDGSAIRWARPDRGRMKLRCTPGLDRVLADVHPSGQEYLTTPHHGADELLRHRFDDDRSIDRLPAAVALSVAHQWGASQTGWSYCAGYLTDEVILASVEDDAYHWHALVKRSLMGMLGLVEYGPHVGAPGWFMQPRAGTWVTISRTGLQRWELGEPREHWYGTQLHLLEDT
jgi:hypothetical protein